MCGQVLVRTRVRVSKHSRLGNCLALSIARLFHIVQPFLHARVLIGRDEATLIGRL